MLNARSISRLAKIDWDFAGSFSESRFSAIHWHPGRFASQLPASLIGLLSSPGDLVLDPFVGSGTTLVESQRLGRRSIGIDLNPISCLISRAKTQKAEASKIKRVVVEIEEDATSLLASQQRLNRAISARVQVPQTVQRHKWYTSRVFSDLAKLWALIHTYTGIKRILAEAAFSSALLPVCRETRHWGYVCDNSSPKEDHEGDVLREFLTTATNLAEAYVERDSELAVRLGSSKQIEESRVVCGSSIEAMNQMPTGSIDLVVTSPPYFGVCDYIKAQRLSMEWFEAEIEPLRMQEIGARSKRHRTAAREAYLKELSLVFAQAKRVVRPQGKLAVIAGESKTRASILNDFRGCLEVAGFRLELDVNRRVSSQRRQAPSIYGEHVLVLSA